MDASIFLIGYRAVGKTTIGKKLADNFQFSFVDTDVLICDRKGATVHAIVQAEGWDGFRQCEQEVLQGLAGRRRCVIATGGGAILHRILWPQLKKHGLVIWLTADVDVLCQRILSDNASAPLRPSLTGKGVDAEVREVLALREPLYRETADIIIDTGKFNVEEAVDEIVRQMAGLASSRETQYK
jgi:shikimate kinase